MKSLGFSSILSSGNHFAMMWVTWNKEYWLLMLTPIPTLISIKVTNCPLWKNVGDLLPMIDNLLQVLLALKIFRLHWNSWTKLSVQLQHCEGPFKTAGTLIMVISITRISLTRAFFRNSLLSKTCYQFDKCISVFWGEAKNRCGKWTSNWPESCLALSLSPGQVKILAHDGNVSPPSLVQGEHSQPGLSLKYRLPFIFSDTATD